MYVWETRNHHPATCLEEEEDDDNNNDGGQLIVFENWLNHARVVQVAQALGLQIQKLVTVQGHELTLQEQQQQCEQQQHSHQRQFQG